MPAPSKNLSRNQISPALRERSAGLLGKLSAFP
jgi:hypothetical protein